MNQHPNVIRISHKPNTFEIHIYTFDSWPLQTFLAMFTMCFNALKVAYRTTQPILYPILRYLSRTNFGMDLVTPPIWFLEYMSRLHAYVIYLVTSLYFSLYSTTKLSLSPVCHCTSQWCFLSHFFLCVSMFLVCAATTNFFLFDVFSFYLWYLLRFAYFSLFYWEICSV